MLLRSRALSHLSTTPLHVTWRLSVASRATGSAFTPLPDPCIQMQTQVKEVCEKGSCSCQGRATTSTYHLDLPPRLTRLPASPTAQLFPNIPHRFFSQGRISILNNCSACQKMAAGRKRMHESASPAPAPAPKASRTQAANSPGTAQAARNPGQTLLDGNAQAQLARIAQSGRSPYEKRVWTALCHIPKGCVTTYALLSAHLGSSPRAVGNALRRNPFAPDVPCHRVVATGMTLGGFKGKWPRDGEGITLDEKRRLLRSEGIRFDDKGKVLGTSWTGWTYKGSVKLCVCN